MQRWDACAPSASAQGQEQKILLLEALKTCNAAAMPKAPVKLGHGLVAKNIEYGKDVMKKCLSSCLSNYLLQAEMQDQRPALMLKLVLRQV